VYFDDVNRDAVALQLNLEALKAFSDTVTVTHRAALAAEGAAVTAWARRGGFAAGLPFPWGSLTLTRAMIEYVNYDNLKIASGFELHLKARLPAHDFLVHEIDPKTPGCKKLAREQARRPINKHELFAIQEYRFDGGQNYLPGLEAESLKFSWLTDRPTYRAALELTDQQLDIIRDYRNLRNQIHFPGDMFEAPAIQAYPPPITDFIVAFVNTEIVDWSHRLMAQYPALGGFRPPVHL
jgi:hypothetical protein